MSRRILAGFLAVTFIFGSASARAGSGPLLHVERVEAVDATGFERPLTAFSMLVPVDWRNEGGVVWQIDDACNTLGFNFQWQAVSPDGLSGVAVLPTRKWVFNPAGGPLQHACPQVRITSARDFLEWQVSSIRPDARLLDYRPRPDLVREAAGAAGRQTYPYGETETVVDAGEVLVGYRENGHEVRAAVASVVVMWAARIHPMYGMPGSEIRGGTSMPGFAAFAPDGRLDLRAAELIRKSMVPGAEWSQRIARHQARTNQITQDGISARARITAEHGREMSRIIADGYAERSAIQDRGQRETIETIRGVETYDDPVNGGTVQLDNSFAHAWQLDNGTFVLTDDAFFQPFRDLGIDGRPLNATQ